MKPAFQSLCFLLFAFLIFSCGTDTNADYHMERRYWDVADYKNALYQMDMRTRDGEKKPCYGTEKEGIFLKLIDENNFKVVLDDTVLGVKHRSEYAQSMFDEFRKMVNAYEALDAEDKYVYPRELVDVEKFGLALQVYYFKLGNDKILKNSDSPNDAETQRVIKSNEQTVLGNFNIYLDMVNTESSFSPEAIVKYAQGIDTHFERLLTAFPKADYHPMISKTELMLKKAVAKEIITSLTNLLSRLQATHQAQIQAQAQPQI